MQSDKKTHRREQANWIETLPQLDPIFERSSRYTCSVALMWNGSNNYHLPVSDIAFVPSTRLRELFCVNYRDISIVTFIVNEILVKHRCPIGLPFLHFSQQTEFMSFASITILRCLARGVERGDRTIVSVERGGRGCPGSRRPSIAIDKTVPYTPVSR